MIHPQREAALATTYRVSRALGIHPETLRRFVKTGKLPARKIFGRYRFRVTDVAFFRRWGPPNLTIGQAAKALGVHPDTVAAWTDRGLLRAARDGRGRIYQRRDVVRLARERRAQRRGRNARGAR